MSLEVHRVLPAGGIKRIHVNQHVIKKNVKEGTTDPAITVKTSSDNVYAHEVYILGTSKLVYRPDQPLSCGARLWIETHAGLDLLVEK